MFFLTQEDITVIVHWPNTHISFPHTKWKSHLSLTYQKVAFEDPAHKPILPGRDCVILQLNTCYVTLKKWIIIIITFVYSQDCWSFMQQTLLRNNQKSFTTALVSNSWLTGWLSNWLIEYFNLLQYFGVSRQLIVSFVWVRMRTLYLICQIEE